jgi:hypothetical protein
VATAFGMPGSQGGHGLDGVRFALIMDWVLEQTAPYAEATRSEWRIYR